ncbi:hypothetical protein EVAR_87430_1 [Eumeta japonica]|uniref:Uncharacterized protein n=1 Tax=Eumeta variegata TaxID=151549 RepID=A0A4C1XI22_EUMVA|nr:hypothetical protein EVAR_87430_1 [Eumeta japonica]
MRLKGKVAVEPPNADPSILIDLALIRAKEDAAVLASSYQKEYINMLTVTNVYMIDDGNKREITMDEIMKALKRMKVGKAAGYDRVSSEMLRGNGDIVASLLYQLFNKCWKSNRVPNNWCKVVIVLLYKEKGSRQTKVMVLERGQRTTECDIIIKGEKAEQVKEFVYLGSLFTNDGKHDRYIERRGNVRSGSASIFAKTELGLREYASNFLSISKRQGPEHHLYDQLGVGIGWFGIVTGFCTGFAIRSASSTAASAAAASTSRTTTDTAVYRVGI